MVLLLFFLLVTDKHFLFQSLIKKLDLVEDDFTFCPEFTAQISKLNIKIHEVPITYNGRIYAEGKKITFKDGLRALQVLWKNYKN